MRRIKPPALPDGGTIAVVAPSSPPQIRSDTEQATDYFTNLGYNVIFGPHHREVHGYLAGIDEHRAADLQWALTEPGSTWSICLGGGYGAARLYPQIDWDALGDPRIVCGFWTSPRSTSRSPSTARGPRSTARRSRASPAARTS